MPIYVYECDSCDGRFEYMQSMSEAPLRVCPNCMGPLRKLMYPAGIIFKGSGSSSSSEAAKPAEAKADSKPAKDKPSKAKAASD